MKKTHLGALIVLLVLLGIGFIATTNAQAGNVGFAYGTGFQNIPPNRFAYVTQTVVYAQPITFSSHPTATRETTMVASAGAGAYSATGLPSKPSGFYSPKKELLPLTGPRLN